jgi:hypothetical protein
VGFYSTNADVRRYISLCALPSLTTGDPTAPTTDDDQIEFAREFAYEDINGFIVNQYDLTTADAVKPNWLSHTEAIFICVWIFRHTSNGTVPPGLQQQYDERMQALQQISQGQRQIPGLSVRSDPGVSMSNLHIDQRFDSHKIRTQPWTNTGDQRSEVVRNNSTHLPFE